jgi:branched-chain amino acid transport system ATP-binding protein
MTAPLLAVTGASKRFGGLLAVDNASLSVKAGGITGLIGPNGAGKTTLFSLISGFERATSGAIVFDGADISALPPHRRAALGIARTFQIVQPFAAQTVRENIAVGAHLHEPRRATALAAAERIAQRVGLAPLLDQPAGELTVAGRKRLELARALATRPKLLLLDEVLAGLNPQEIAEMIPVVRALVHGDAAAGWTGGITVLMIEHVMQAVMNLADHVWVLAQGRLIAQGTPAEVTNDDRVIEAYLGHGSAARLQKVAR